MLRSALHISTSGTQRLGSRAAVTRLALPVLGSRVGTGWARTGPEASGAEPGTPGDLGRLEVLGEVRETKSGSAGPERSGPARPGPRCWEGAGPPGTRSHAPGAASASRSHGQAEVSRCLLPGGRPPGSHGLRRPAAPPPPASPALPGARAEAPGRAGAGPDVRGRASRARPGAADPPGSRLARSP